MRGLTKLKMALTGLVVAVGAFFAFNAVYSTAEAGNCSGNSVVKCGVTSITDLRNAYNGNRTAGTQTIYSYMGISSNTVNKAQYKMGTVNKDGTVKVGSTIVAKNA